MIASLHSFFTRGTLEPSAGGSISEGIGQSRITGNLEGFAPDLTRGAGGPVAAEASARVAESGGAEAARGAASEPRADEKVEAALVGVAEVQPEGAREEPRLLLAGAAGSPGGGRSDTAAGDRAPVEGPPAQPSGDAPDLGSGRWVQIIPREAGEG